MAKLNKTQSGGKKLSHVSAEGLPKMVDVADKAPGRRSASAQAEVLFPKEVARLLQARDMRSKKGAVLDTAIIAGTMAVKNTPQLIPFCHALHIEACDFDIGWKNKTTLRILCTVACTGKTGVEMEALTGASVSALTVYDMCKALSHDIEIGAIRLLAKHGGKSGVIKS